MDCPSRTIRFSTCIASRMHRRTVSLFASSPATRSFIWRTPRASCRASMLITFPRCRMISTSGCLVAACAAVCLVFGTGCDYLRQDMANQPKNKPLSPSPFFEDGRSGRPLVENTVARGSFANDELFVPKESNNFPLPVNLELREKLNQSGPTGAKPSGAKPGGAQKPETGSTKDSAGGSF